MANASAGNLVPAWYFPQFLGTRWGYDGWDWALNDIGYTQNIPQCLVGRIPAETAMEISAYIQKASQYLLTNPTLPWVHQILRAGDDVYFAYNGVPGTWTRRWHQRWSRQCDASWVNDDLYTSDYQGPGQEDTRFDLLELRFNQGRGIITFYGPRAAAWRLANWYDDSEVADYEFTNSGMYPLIIGASCDLGAYDEWWFPNEAEGCTGTPHEYECIIEQLLFLPNGGCIAALAATGATTSSADGKWTEMVFKTISQENTRNLARIGKRATELATPYYQPTEGWTYPRFQLLGDPTLALPAQIQASGSWTVSNSPYRITSTLSIPPNGSLTIDPGVTVIFAPGVGLTVSAGASLIANGTAAQPIHLQAVGSAVNQAWRGIEVQSANPVTSLSHCTFDNASVGVRTAAASVATLASCTFTNCGIGITSFHGAVVTATNSAISTSRYYGAVAAARGILNMSGGSITNSARVGLWSASIARTDLDNVTLTGNGPPLINNRNLNHGGLRNTYSNLKLNCVNSSSNNGPGISAWGGQTDMAWRIADNGRNLVQNNNGYNGGRTQLYFCQTIADLCNGRNKIAATTGNLIEDCWPLAREAQGNYWGEAPSPVGRIPATYSYNPTDANSSDARCNLLSLGTCEVSDAAYYFGQGWNQENALQYTEAIVSYKYVIVNYPTSKEALWSPARIAFCEGQLNKDWATLRTYLLTVADTASEADLKYSLRSAAAWCLVELNDFTGAFAEFATLMNQAATQYQYQKVALDSLLTELKTAPWDSIGLSRRDGNNTLDQLPEEARAEVQGDHQLWTLFAMEQILSGQGFRGSGEPPLPTEYRLYQNYPNPFNPTTEIQFDLPENARVKLRIYNTLGQLVATLLNGPREAGQHTVTWDASEMPSGLYIYRLEARSFVDAKKMILIR
ncbi:T9SS type A sorting domain-containing protein [candidate division KSB1 bacterium]|nr:T9SS type A sorting domain-containing protein [candidate division KSB1 bacterium]